MDNPIKKIQEKRIDNLYKKKKEATILGDNKRKDKLEKKITNIRGRSLSESDMVFKKGGAKKSSYKKRGTIKSKK